MVGTAPSTLQQVQVGHAPKNSKPRNGIEFFFQDLSGAAAAKPPPKLALTISHTPSVTSYIQVLNSSYC